MRKPCSPFGLAIDLFHAQSLLGKISMSLPFGPQYDDIRKELFVCSMRLLDIMDSVQNIEDSCGTTK